ncbi:uncharacterized protein LOC130718875 [Lotus japonicus]|uniref:uncharacterized protein LOC130718875 n=1 Tax=Lotus japonicus TaxID=34305 RepID=UPI00258E1942|nr:uncharacterized protein LOC130718875 [Lotus japonicus]
MIDATNWTKWPGIAAGSRTDEFTPISGTSGLLGSGVDQLSVVVDGSWNAGRKRMGASAVLRDHLGNWISGTSTSYGHGNAFLAEILAVEIGLNHAWELGFRSVLCFSDCKQVVEVFGTAADVSTFWARDTITRIRALVSREWKVEFCYVPRERNNAADSLAREASREGTQRRVWSTPPSSIIASLYLDANP